MSTEEYTDEIICENHTISDGKGRISRIFELLGDTLTSEEFTTIQDDFVEQNCNVFEENGDLQPQCMGIYRQYVKLVEDHLLSKLSTEFPDFQFEELIPVIKKYDRTNLEYADVFEVLTAVLDFEEFRSLMVSYKCGQGISFDITTIKLD